MASNEKNNTEPVLQFTPAQLQEFMQQLTESQSKSMVDAMKAYAQAQKEPSEAEKERIRVSKEEWAEVIRQAAETKKALQDNCNHIQPDSGKYRIWRFFTAFPDGAWTLICSACQKTWTNYEVFRNERGRDSIRLKVHDPEFVRIWDLPTVSPKDKDDKYWFRTA